MVVFAAAMVVIVPADVTRADGIGLAQIAAGAVGAVRMAAPAVLEGAAVAEGGGAAAGSAGLVCATGIGCVVLAVAAVGVVAYATKDYWLPYVQQGVTSLNDHAGPDDSLLGMGVVNWPTQPPSDLAGQESCDGAHIDYDDGQVNHAPMPVSCGNVTIRMTYPTAQLQGPYTYKPTWDGDEYGFGAITTTVCRNVEGGPDLTVEGLYHDWFYFQPNSGVDARQMALTPCSGLLNTTYNALVQRPDGTPAGHYVPIKITVRGSHQNAGFVASWTAPWADTIGGPTQVRAVTLCRPAGGPSDGSQDYLVNGDVTDAAHANLVQVKACNSGDTSLAVSTQQGRGGVWTTTQRTDLTALRADDARYPQCAGGACAYQVFVDHQACTATTQGTDCANWTVIAKQDATRVECHYGPYVVNVADCYPLERAYEPDGAPATSANTDGNPDTYTSPAPVRTPVADPTPTATGSSSPSPTATGTTGTGTGTGTSPGVAGSPATSDPTSERDCFPSGWTAFNPVQWVLHPIRCAFEPDPSRSLARQTEITGDLSHTGITPLLNAATSVVGQLGGAAGSGGGCLGPEVTFSMSGINQSLHPFAACDPPISYLAAMARAVISLSVIIGGGIGLVRAVGSGFGWSFSFGRSGGES